MGLCSTYTTVCDNCSAELGASFGGVAETRRVAERAGWLCEGTRWYCPGCWCQDCQHSDCICREVTP